MLAIDRITKVPAIGTADTNGCGYLAIASTTTGFMGATSVVANFAANMLTSITITTTKITIKPDQTGKSGRREINSEN